MHGSLGRGAVFHSLPLDYFDVQDFKLLVDISSFEMIVASSQHYGLKCLLFARCLMVYKKNFEL